MPRIIKNANGDNIPSEYQEQVAVGKYLDKLGLLWCHVGNEREGAIQGFRLKAAGVKAGVPDILIFTPPPTYYEVDSQHVHGVAIELKKRNGKPRDVRVKQWIWLDKLMNAGWLVHLAFGAQDAVKYINQVYSVTQVPD